MQIPEDKAHWLHIWILQHPKVSQDKANFARSLSPEETERAARFKYPEDQQRYRVAHTFLRKVLGNYLDLSPHEIAFTKGFNNKPLLNHPQYPGIHFNLSYRDQLFLLAVSNAEHSGVDVEKCREIVDIPAFIELYFSEEEQRIIQSFPKEKDKIDALFSFWALKEAVIKALGTGFLNPLPEYDLSAFYKSGASQFCALLNDTWTIRNLSVHRDYRAAFAVKTKNIRVKTFAYEL